jgi:hypothetical protein
MTFVLIGEAYFRRVSSSHATGETIDIVTELNCVEPMVVNPVDQVCASKKEMLQKTVKRVLSALFL